MSLLHAVPLSHEQPIPQGAGAAKPRTKKAGSGDKDRVAVHQRASSRHVVQAAFLALGEQPQPIAKPKPGGGGTPSPQQAGRVTAHWARLAHNKQSCCAPGMPCWLPTTPF